MSRCFPYNSYVTRNGASSDPLIQFIKEDGKSKAEKRKEKRERKERRAEKRKRKAGLSNCADFPTNKKPKQDTGQDNEGSKLENKTPKTEAVLRPVSDKGDDPRSKRRRTNGEEPPPSIVPTKSALRLPKNPAEKHPVPNTVSFMKVEESELLEKSALTEENELPVYLPNFIYSSANSQILRKRIQPVSLNSARPPGGGGSINKIRIRMQSQCSQENPVENRTPVCSTSGRVVGPTPDPLKPPEPTVVVQSVHDKTRTRLDPVYESLLARCLPPLLPADPDGDDWLFGSRGRHPETTAVEKVSEITGCSRPSDGDRIQWPRACYLPEACVYVLPYMVPY